MLKNIEIFLLLGILLVNSFLAIYIINPNLTSMVIFETNNAKTPSDFVKEEQIFSDSERVIIDLNNSVLNRYSDSESMFPLLNKNSTGIGFRPENETEINEGDIISFWNNEKLIVHRVVKKDFDEKGVYFITKGDNNINDDKTKTRFSDINSVLVGIIY